MLVFFNTWSQLEEFDLQYDKDKINYNLEWVEYLFILYGFFSKYLIRSEVWSG
jgi:hypothetical protein